MFLKDFHYQQVLDKFVSDYTIHRTMINGKFIGSTVMKAGVFKSKHDNHEDAESWIREQADFSEIPTLHPFIG